MELKELEDITIDFNKYLETVTVNLEHLETGVQNIVTNIRTEINELAKGTKEIIGDMRRDLDQGRTVVPKLLKMVNSLRSALSTNSPVTTISPIQSVASSTLPTITSINISKPSSSSSFLEKEKEMQELKVKLLSKRIIALTIQPKKVLPFDICDPFLTAYYRTTQQVYLKLNELSQIFYSGGKSLFSRVTTCTGSNPSAIHQLHEYGYLDMVYQTLNSRNYLYSLLRYLKLSNLLERDLFLLNFTPFLLKKMEKLE